MTDYTVIIPARFASQRLPGKPLRDIAGKPLIQRTYEAVLRSDARRAIVATDDEGIAQTVRGFSGEVCMTSPNHESGTDRVAEAAQQLGLQPDEIIVNVQGDEPDMPGALIDQVVAALVQNVDAKMSTASCMLDQPAQYFDSSVVKLVVDRDDCAIYFSRAPIPFARVDDGSSGERVPWNLVRRHIGIYAYRVDYLQKFSSTPPCALELSERLEQLRALWLGDKIAVSDTQDAPSVGVDTLADLDRAIRHFKLIE